MTILWRHKNIQPEKDVRIQMVERRMEVLIRSLRDCLSQLAYLT